MDDVDPDVSNGSCWANVNVALAEEYIPCGNAADGNSYACCRYGDNCLSSNACYHSHFGITYLAGCTTQDFSGPACQNKGIFVNQSWVGLTRCDPDQNWWAGCPEEKNIVGSNPPTPNCKCSDDALLFEDAPTLENIASLPLRLGGTISWFPGHSPTVATRTGSPLPTSSRAMSSITIPPTSSDGPSQSGPPVPTSTSAVPPATELSTGEKAGIGVSIAGGALAIGCIIAIMVKKWKEKNGNSDLPSPQHRLSPVQPGPDQNEPPVPMFSVLGGFKAELPADDPLTANANTTLSLEPNPISPISTGSTTTRQYIPYRPGVYGPDNRYSTVSQLSSQTQGYADSTVSALSPQPSGEPHNEGIDQSKSERPDTIHELE
ncbi:hypothetical protein F4861DRAFT_272688 [Xylaria intraflava]|nr:hypothetical protein F4861DRAFT_272688 [Xylaria intraflava]